MDDSEIQKRAARIKLLLMDCDGVLTDGRLLILENNDDQKTFYARDGLGIELWHRAGLKSGVISGRTSSALERRARKLGMTFVWQGCEDKHKAFDVSLAEAGVSADEVAYVGDDLVDIPLMRRSGVSFAVADATAETREQADYITKANGGRGAVREVIEFILKAQGKWNDIVKGY
jgi:3-deoxy-D-manno-octulosonate 8-phosphate phosphatase (KDO 8-P phosphatase)